MRPFDRVCARVYLEVVRVRFALTESKRRHRVARALAKGEEMGKGSSDAPITVRIPYARPYRYDQLIDFLRFRAIKGVEVVDESGRYARTCVVDGDVGWITVDNDEAAGEIVLRVSESLSAHADDLARRTRLLFDTDCDPVAVTAALSDFYARVDARYRIEGVRLPCSFEPFEMSMRAILGQQITVKAANTLAGRVADEFGISCEMPVLGLTCVFPSASAFLGEDVPERLGRLGVIGRRAQAICLLARALHDGSIRMGPNEDVEANAKALLALPGIGPWTVNYLLMRAFHHADALPAADYGVKLAFSGMTPRQIEKASEAWRPYRSYAVMSTWCVPHE